MQTKRKEKQRLQNTIRKVRSGIKIYKEENIYKGYFIILKHTSQLAIEIGFQEMGKIGDTKQNR